MKLVLSRSLRLAVLASFASALTCTVQAGIMSTEIDQVVYTDFGQNKGRYAVGNTNALTKHLQEQGVYIYYKNGPAPYLLEGGVVDFRNSTDNAMMTLISENFVATASHNNLGMQTFSTAEVGAGNAIYYSLIEVQNSKWHIPGGEADYKVTRLSKIVTDATPVASYTGDAAKLVGQKMYRIGSGSMQYGEGSTGSDGKEPSSGSGYVAGGIVNIASVEVNSTDNTFKYTSDLHQDRNNLSSNPLPYYALSGDSGSPGFVWNSDAMQYEFATTLQGEAGSRNIGHGDHSGWGTGVADSYDVHVDMSTHSSIMIHAPEASVNDSSAHIGHIQENGTNIYSYKGLKVVDKVYTWSSLTAEKDKDNWYAYYSGSYLISNYQTTLFDTQNLVFTSKNAENTITMGGDDVDLGVGYAEFRAAEGATGIVKYTITDGTTGGNTQFNHAGYVVGKGVEVHLQIRNSDLNYYTREWRKIGEGDLYIEGNGNNDVLLNLGGSGKTYLNQTNDGYAAYNVLANTGATVVIKDINQIERDFTFGAGGGTLDMNGNSMAWYTTSETTTDDYTNYGRDGFSIKALTEEAVIANYAKGTTSTLTYKEGGTFLGSFRDSAQSALKVVYDGGGTWELNSIRTKLEHEDSGLQVNNGKVVLTGTKTVHAAGSATGATSASQVYTNDNDWHYADATMNVKVEKDATFELGSHARLMGNVTVAEGGTYIMREGVKHAQEYIEGGYSLESTADISAFYGHKGDTSLGKGATLMVDFNEGVTTNTTYSGNISGEGNMTVKTTGGSLTLTGENTFTGTKRLESGSLIFEDIAAMGGNTDTNKWVVEAGASVSWLDENVSADDFLSKLDSSSKGTLVLGSDYSGEHIAGMTVGALEGRTVNYGTSTEKVSVGKESTLYLGGGGGTLMVHYELSGETDASLSVGRGTVVLANKQNMLYNVTVTLESTDSTFAIISPDLSDYIVKGTGKLGVTLRDDGNDLIKAARGEEYSAALRVLGGTLALDSPYHELRNFTALELDDGVKVRANTSRTQEKAIKLSGNSDFDIADNATLTLANSLTGKSLTKKGNGVLNLVSTVSLNSMTIVNGKVEVTDGKNGISIAGNNTEAQIKASIERTNNVVTISNGSLNGALIDILEGSRLQLKDVTLDATMRITDAPATLSVSHTSADVVVGTNATAKTETLSDALTLQNAARDKLVVAAGSKVLSISSTLIDTVSIVGDSLTLRIIGVDASSCDLISLIFTDGTNAATFADLSSTAVTATIQGYQGEFAAYFTGDGKGVSTLYFAVPEPTTATLSLLALGALAMRRRRHIS